MHASEVLTEAKRRLALMVARAVVKLVDDTSDLQVVQVARLADELTDAERFGEYGLASNPPADSEAVVLSVGGVRSHAVVIAVENRKFRLKSLKPGEVALYDDIGQQLYLTRDGIVITSPKKLTFSAPAAKFDIAQVEFTGQVTVDDTFTAKAQWALGGAGGKALKHVDDTPTTTGVAK